MDIRTVAQVTGHATIQKVAEVAKLADAPDLGSGGVTRRGSSPLFRTNYSSRSLVPGPYFPGSFHANNTPPALISTYCSPSSS